MSGVKHCACVLCSVCVVLLLLLMVIILMRMVANIIGTLTSVPVAVVNVTYIILMNAQNKHVSRD